MGILCYIWLIDILLPIMSKIMGIWGIIRLIGRFWRRCSRRRIIRSLWVILICMSNFSGSLVSRRLWQRMINGLLNKLSLISKITSKLLANKNLGNSTLTSIKDKNKEKLV